METQYINKADKLLNKFIFESKKFVEYSCFPYGVTDQNKIENNYVNMVDDYEYFSFTKSTKTLISIKKLLHSSLNEDAMILLRSIFENYLSTRYLQEHPQEIDEFISNPIQLTLRKYIVKQGGIIVDREQTEIGKQPPGPSGYKLGKDKKYFTDFYEVLSRYAHCNFGIIDHYLDIPNYTYEKDNNPLLIRLYVIFVFTKLFESIVTVRGEDHKDVRTKESCYKLVEESLIFQDSLFLYFIDFIEKNNESESFKFHQRHMKDLMKNMRKSLREPLGDVIKTFFDEM
ncbi:DUF5677 domain-containing protein [Aquibacillus koreensis]|uniref:DUF5677 domain-containing protein n=1 Tax=Aquibacillus koreensis TaxID=279446 RepID=A0A9X4AH81_9BACI|nr:DUF5677 domain-containing protein [Aquibacillus koreensis]MCT2534658.1 DUF5677 domain-containing protein [Aquibacillus koreensis]MDC3419842.1 DUF5677 domain-containing protein [Aquibacillus koreensis]